MARLIALFPLWAVLGSALAYGRAEWFTALQPAIVPLLGVVMFAMGARLTLGAFADILRRPGLIGLGLALQYGIMPLAAWLVGTALGLPAAVIAGLVLVGACPGGTASNLICYLARGDLALSVTLTLASTLAAVILTPGLTWLYVGQWIPVPVGAMLLSILQVVIAPILLGLAARRLAGRWLDPLESLFSLLAMAAIVLIIAIIVALNREHLATAGALVALAVVLHNSVGLAAGYWLARALGQDEIRARTLAIEVGMQNSGLAVALAVKYFTPAAALPGALFSVWHNLSGATLAGVWARLPVDQNTR